MKRQAGLLILLMAHSVFSAPIDKKEDVDKRRESTPEILDLEKQLKVAAGEDKKFFTNPNSQPIPQIDGLTNELPNNMPGAAAVQDIGSKDETQQEEQEQQYAAVEENIPQAQDEIIKDPATPMETVQDAPEIPIMDEEQKDPETLELDQSEQRVEDPDVAGPLGLVEDDADQEGADEEELAFYNNVWRIFQEHPEYLQQLLEEAEYTPEDIQELYLRGQYAALANQKDEQDLYPYGMVDEMPKRGSNVYENEAGERYVPVMDQLGYAESLVPSDEDDRLDAMEAEMAAAAHPGLPQGDRSVAPYGGNIQSYELGRPEGAELYGSVQADPLENELADVGEQQGLSRDIYGQKEPAAYDQLPYMNELYQLYQGDKDSHHVAKKGSQYQPGAEVSKQDDDVTNDMQETDDEEKTENTVVIDKDVKEMMDSAEKEAKAKSDKLALPAVM